MQSEDNKYRGKKMKILNNTLETIIYVYCIETIPEWMIESINGTGDFIC